MLDHEGLQNSQSGCESFQVVIEDILPFFLHHYSDKNPKHPFFKLILDDFKVSQFFVILQRE